MCHFTSTLEWSALPVRFALSPELSIRPLKLFAKRYRLNISDGSGMSSSTELMVKEARAIPLGNNATPDIGVMSLEAESELMVVISLQRP